MLITFKKVVTIISIMTEMNIALYLHMELSLGTMIPLVWAALEFLDPDACFT